MCKQVQKYVTEPLEQLNGSQPSIWAHNHPTKHNLALEFRHYCAREGNTSTHTWEPIVQAWWIYVNTQNIYRILHYGHVTPQPTVGQI